MSENNEEILEYILEVLERMSDSYLTNESPTLKGALQVGSYSIVYNVRPKQDVLHGYEIGWSGETSFMKVIRNDTGFACPLYMTKKGQWSQCSAEHGTRKMPCRALALGEDEGTKEILWKGIVRKGIWSWTPGDTIYVSTVEGALTKVKPIDGSWAQPIGMAISKDAIRFDPGFYLGEINL